MSGIALVFHLDGRPAAADDLSGMLAELSARGPDGEGRLTDGPVALGHRLLASTPEAAVEPMPLLDPESGCRITGHIRLDNRDELLAQFGLQRGARVVGDGELVLKAWLRWKQACVKHLLGDFAFALWDPREQQVFAARDQTGMRQLVYTHLPGRIFACASSARALVRAPGIVARLNELRVAESLLDFEWGNLETTFYQDVYRLQPGYCLSVDVRGLRQHRYWQMEVPEPLLLKNDAAYAEAFREVLGEAVRCRLRGGEYVGSMLSGGMDSGSVVALACRMTPQPLPTFSCVGPDSSNCVETAAIHAALAMPNLAPVQLDYSRMEPWVDDLITLSKQIGEPFDFHMTQPRMCYMAARRAGLKVLLDGVAGDVVLSEGSQMVRHIRAGHWMRAWRDARGLQRFWADEGDAPAWQQLWLAVRGAYMPDTLRRLRTAWRTRRSAILPHDAVIEPDFANRVGLYEVLQAWQREEHPRRMDFTEERIWSWPRSGLTVGRERYDRVAAESGIEARDPYMDRRVVNFCLSLPMDQFQADGWLKVIQRRAMAGLLPDPVRWRRGKQHLGWNCTNALMTHWPDWPTRIDAAASGLRGRVCAPYLNRSRIHTDPLDALPHVTGLVLQLALFLSAADLLPEGS